MIRKQQQPFYKPYKPYQPYKPHQPHQPYQPPFSISPKTFSASPAFVDWER